MKKILLALHGGPSADGAVHVAHLLRARTGASIEAVAVLEPLPAFDYGYAPAYVPDPATEDELEDQLHADVERQLVRCDLGGATLAVLRGPRASTILDRARSCAADLIVLGLGPHHFMDRALGGETALHLAQHASTPVLAVPPDARTLPHRILVAVDFSPASLAAARLAASLLTGGDTLALAHVGAAAQIGSIVMGPIKLSDAFHRVDEFAAELERPTGVLVTTDVLAGEPTRRLLDLAAETKADAIALGSHGYSLWQRVLLGSVSSKVLRLARCSVLIYPARCVVETAPAQHAEALAGAAAT